MSILQEKTKSLPDLWVMWEAPFPAREQLSSANKIFPFWRICLFRAPSKSVCLLFLHSACIPDGIWLASSRPMAPLWRPSTDPQAPGRTPFLPCPLSRISDLGCISSRQSSPLRTCQSDSSHLDDGTSSSSELCPFVIDLSLIYWKKNLCLSLIARNKIIHYYKNSGILPSKF